WSFALSREIHPLMFEAQAGFDQRDSSLQPSFVIGRRLLDVHTSGSKLMSRLWEGTFQSDNRRLYLAHRLLVIRSKPLQHGVPVREDFALGHGLAAITLLLAEIDDGVKVFLLALDIPGVRILVYGADIQLLAVQGMARANLSFQKLQHLVHVFHPRHAPRLFDVERSVGCGLGLGGGVVGLRGLALHHLFHENVKNGGSTSSRLPPLGGAIPRARSGVP